MMSETWDAERIAEAANHPAIFPWICGRQTEPANFVEQVKDRNNIFLFGEFGGFYFRNLDGRIFDAHSMVLPEGRGHWAMTAAESALTWIFKNTNAQEVTMSVPKGNLAVRALVKRLGATFRGKIEGGWHLKGKDVDIDVYSMMKEDWLCR